MRSNASRTEHVARDIANAELDKKFIEMTNNVSVALGGAAVQVRRLNETADEIADLTHGRPPHALAALRGAGRHPLQPARERTPKPGLLRPLTPLPPNAPHGRPRTDLRGRPSPLPKENTA